MDWMDLVFPKKCVGCGHWGKYVCDSCEVGLWEEEQICPICARASRYGLRHTYCNRSPGLEGLTCLWAYEGIAQKIITKAKYNYYYDFLGELLVNSPLFFARPEYTLFRRFLELKPVVVPVPLYFKREKERGFNQAQVISLSLSKSVRLGMKDCLVRVKDTGRQVGRGREERLKNMANAFALNPKFPIPKNVLLVDDVWTMGATMNECSRVLIKAGAGRVWGFVLAR